MTDLNAKGLTAAKIVLQAEDMVNPIRASDPIIEDVTKRILRAYLEATPPEAVNDKLVAALVRQRDNIDRWLATGVAAGPEESKSIYEQICAALDNAESARIATKEGE